MAIAHAATEYVFSDFMLKDPGSGAEGRYKGVRLELAVDKMVTCIAVGLPLLLISLAFAQEVSVGTQISCFSPTSFSWRQALYVDNFCWAALSSAETGNLPLWLHKFFPYILLLVAVLVYLPALFWRFSAAPALCSDLMFIMQELDGCYNRAIKLAQRLATSGVLDLDSHSSALDLTESCFRYPLVEQYLRTKRLSRGLLARYLLCRGATFLALSLACAYLGMYTRLASLSDEFACRLRTGMLRNDSSIPEALQCKLVAVGTFQLLSGINLCVYVLMLPACVYAMLRVVVWHGGGHFLKVYEMLPTMGVLELSPWASDDLAIILLFLEENLSQLQSYKRLKVLELLKQGADESIDTMLLLQTLGQVRSDSPDGKPPASIAPAANATGTAAENHSNGTEMKEVSPLLMGGVKKLSNEKAARQRVI